MILPAFATPARMLKRRFSDKPIKRYWGEPNEVCKQIVERCYDEKRGVFVVSAGHFRDFYMRDLGMCLEALIFLGYRKQAILSLAYALHQYKKYNRITTTIREDGKPVNYFAYPTDSLPFLLRSLRILLETSQDKDLTVVKQLLGEYRAFLEHQAEIYCATVFDFQEGRVRMKGSFSSIKDHEHRKSSTYDNAMVGMLSLELDTLGWKNPLHDIKVGQMLVSSRWTGSFFAEDAVSNIRVTGDANTFPFYCGVITSTEMITKSIASMQQAGLDRPFPLKYSNTLSWKHKNIAGMIAPNYEGTTIWAHLGMCYLYVVERVNKPLLEIYLRKYFWNIKQFGNFIEVYNPDGKTPYQSALYYSDESMSWACMYWHLAEKYGIK